MNLAIIQARMASTRLPGKVFLPLGGKPMLERMVERVRRARSVDMLVVATTTEPEDALIADLCDRLRVVCHRGPRDDVLKRFAEVHGLYGWADTTVRLTGDCPLLDAETVDYMVSEHLRRAHDLTVNTGPPGKQTYPDGFDVEVMRGSVLAEVAAQATDPEDREHVTRFIRERPDRYAIWYVGLSPDLSGHKWSVDTPADYKRVSAIFEALDPTNPEFGMDDILEWEARSGAEPALGLAESCF